MTGTDRHARHTPRHRAALVFLLLVYMGVIFALSQRSQLPLPEAFTATPDFLLHLAEYAPLGFLLAIAAGPTRATGAWVAWAVAIFFGATDEFHQSLIPGRQGTISDFLQDAVGAGLGAWLAYLWRVVHRRRAAHRDHGRDR